MPKFAAEYDLMLDRKPSGELVFHGDIKLFLESGQERMYERTFDVSIEFARPPSWTRHVYNLRTNETKPLFNYREGMSMKERYAGLPREMCQLQYGLHLVTHHALERALGNKVSGDLLGIVFDPLNTVKAATFAREEVVISASEEAGALLQKALEALQ